MALRANPSGVANAATQIPRFKAMSSEDAGRFISSWLKRPDLRAAIIISFAFDPGLTLSGGAGQPRETVSGLLDRLATSVELTFVSGLDANPATARAQAVDRALQRLARAGAHVYVHDKLHAKLLLFDAGDRACWVVGSSNLSASGLGYNEEVNLRGFHPDDYREVERRAQQIIDESRLL